VLISLHVKECKERCTIRRSLLAKITRKSLGFCATVLTWSSVNDQGSSLRALKSCTKLCGSLLKNVLYFLEPIGRRLKEISNKAQSENKSDILSFLS
jgi:hypothetical protein